jgi:hypothetical protein
MWLVSLHNSFFWKENMKQEKQHQDLGTKERNSDRIKRRENFRPNCIKICQLLETDSVRYRS